MTSLLSELNTPGFKKSSGDKNVGNEEKRSGSEDDRFRSDVNSLGPE